MKLLQLRFKNLNSLAGEWCIDFTDPVFAQEGIFAIVGPTGAGKSTLLDAICLALYGRTPRLAAINSKSNEILSRHAGDCFAEVTFACRTGTFRCHWSQRRARDHHTGNLQQQKHEFSCAQSGALLSSKENPVSALVKTHVGMDFTQFTRTLLLAQGGFAAFLQADANERAPILEQITGTEIYSQISIVTHERAREERDRLALLEAEAGGVLLLTEEEELALRQHHDTLKAQDVALATEQAKNHGALGWLEKLKSLKEELAMLEQQDQLLLQKKDAFAPDAEKYTQALKALDLSVFFSPLDMLRQEQKQEQAAKAAGLEKLPLLQNSALENKKTYAQAAETLATARKNQEKTQPLILEVQALDVALQEQEKNLLEKEEDLKQKKSAIETKEQEKEKAASRAIEVTKDLDTELQRQARTCVDETLVAQFEAIRTQCRDLKKQWEQLQRLQKRVLALDGERKDAAEQYKELTAIRDRQREKKQELQIRLAGNATALQTVLDGRSLEAWRQERHNVDEQKKLLALYQKNREQTTNLLDQIKRLDADVLFVKNNLETLTQRYATLVQQRTNLEAELAILQRISSLEEERHRLVAGDACPLCGSKDHPYAVTVPPVLTVAEEALMAIRSLVTEQEKKITERKVHLATAQTSRTERIKQEEECVKEHARILKELLSLTGEESCTLGALEVAQWQQRCGRLAAQAQEVLTAGERMHTEAGQIQAELTASSEELVAAERESAKVQGISTGTDAKWTELKHEENTLKEEARLALADLENVLARYDLGEVTENRLDPIEFALKNRLQAWLDGQEARKNFEAFLALYQEKAALYEENIVQATAEVEKLNTVYLHTRQEHDARKEKRIELFGDKSTALEALHLAGQIKTSEKASESARASYDGAKKEVDALSAQLGMLEKSIEERGQRLCAAEKTCADLLAKVGFLDEIAYRNALLSEVDRKMYAAQTLALEREQAVITTGKQEKEKFLQEELDKKITDLLPEQAQTAVKKTDAERALLREQMGALGQRITDALEARRQREGLLRSIEAQRKEYSEWEKLNRLIGSHKGDKFRTFAQGLTFDVMIAHANRQLQKMTDRYLLARAADQPLALTVADAYMAGEERSTRNLSGGESFLVSLALALGLSSMVSSTIQVDSLFLDEGFGSLDEDALETALETLAGLQQENKLIGVISHVPSLKDRIPLQIEVIPQHGGKSVLKGPGCSGGL